MPVGARRNGNWPTGKLLELPTMLLGELLELLVLLHASGGVIAPPQPGSQVWSGETRKLCVARTPTPSKTESDRSREYE